MRPALTPPLELRKPALLIEALIRMQSRNTAQLHFHHLQWHADYLKASLDLIKRKMSIECFAAACSSARLLSACSRELRALASCTLNIATATSASPAFVQGSVKAAESCLAASQPKVQREAVLSLESESHIHLMQLFVSFSSRISPCSHTKYLSFIMHAFSFQYGYFFAIPYQ